MSVKSGSIRGKAAQARKKEANISIEDCINLAKSLTGVGRDRKRGIVFVWWDLVEVERYKANWP